MQKIADLISEKFASILGGILFISLLFFPFIRIHPAAPGFELIDFSIPFLALFFLAKWKNFENKRIYIYLLGFGVYIFITILVNARILQVRDYFEIFKLVKFAIVIGLFSMISYDYFLQKWIKPAFIGLVIFNLIHYYDLFEFNDFLGKYYQAGQRVPRFGLNSIGLPTYKRMLGFLCNPNNNAILFLLFSAFFIPKHGQKLTVRSLSWFFGSLSMVFLCQSRTALLIVAAILVIYSIFLLKQEYKKVLVTIIIACTSFVISTIITRISVSSSGASTIYMNDQFDPYNKRNAADVGDGRYLHRGSTYMETLMDWSAFKTNSMQGRIVIWKHMWSMIKKKPVFGHAPYKEYFYDNELYAESEYMTMAWRYGFIGLAVYLVFLILILVHSFRRIKTETGMVLFISTLIMLVSSVTNNPFAHKTLLLMFGIAIGFFLNFERKNQKQKDCEN